MLTGDPHVSRNVEQFCDVRDFFQWTTRRIIGHVNSIGAVAQTAMVVTGQVAPNQSQLLLRLEALAKVIDRLVVGRSGFDTLVVFFDAETN